MTITEILRYYDITYLAPYSPFILKGLPGRRQTASWWTDILGGPDYSIYKGVVINSVLYNSTTQYESMDSYNDLVAQQDSFYFDFATQELFVHLSTDTYFEQDEYQQGQTDGYTDEELIYVDDIEYKPLLKSSPELSKEADLSSYDKMAFLSGTQVFDNNNGDFDDIIDNNIYGNDVSVYYLPTVKNKLNYTREDLNKLITFYIENYTHTLQEFSIELQDKRKSQNFNILDENEIPRIYGLIKSYTPTVIDDTLASPKYQLGYNLTDIGIVEVEGDYGWVPVSPINIDYTDGTFFVSYISARKNSEIDGTILPIRVREFTGLDITSALDVIVDLNNLPYNTTNYDITAWESAKSVISNIGVVFDKQQTVSEAIQKIQNGCNVGFRYDINPDGKRTILLDDFNKSVVANIDFVEFKNSLTQPVSSNSELLAAICVVQYNYDNIEDSYTPLKDESKYNQVLRQYRQAPTLTIPTYLKNETDAQERATFALARFSSVERTVELVFMGTQYLSFNIYDMITINLSVGVQRAYFGRWKAQIVSTNPDTRMGINSIKALLVERV